MGITKVGEGTDHGGLKPPPYLSQRLHAKTIARRGFVRPWYFTASKYFREISRCDYI